MTCRCSCCPAAPRCSAQPRPSAIAPTGPEVPSGCFAVLLAGALGRIGAQVQMLGADSLNEDPEWFARCEMESSFVLYRADPTATEWTELCLRQADCLIVVRHGDDDRPTMVPFEIESVQTGAVFHRRRELVRLHEGHDPAPGSTSPMLAARASRPPHPLPPPPPFHADPPPARVRAATP